MDRDQYQDREEAGRTLARELSEYADHADAVVYGLARGGVPVAAVVSREIGLPLDALVVRKVGAPGNPELAVGAVTTLGGMVVNEHVMGALGLSKEEYARLADQELPELESQEREIRGEAERVSPEGRVVLLIDDGLATGASMAAAVKAARSAGAEKVVVGIPTASNEACSRIRELADEVRCLMTPDGFTAVGQWYRDFEQVSTARVRELLLEARHR